MSLYDTGTFKVLDAIYNERKRQDEKWGPVQDHPDVHPDPNYAYDLEPAEYYKGQTDRHAREGNINYLDILLEEVAEAADEAKAGNRDALRTELIQVAAVAVKWVEILDRQAQL